MTNGLTTETPDPNKDNLSSELQPGSQPDPELTFLAAEAAYDHGVLITYGEVGGGSYAVLETKRLTLDPEHCATREGARFVSAHEGGHIAHTGSLIELGKTPEQIRAYSGMLGFHPLRNVIEDGAINDFNVLRFPLLAPDTLASYARPSPDEALGFIDVPEGKVIEELLGRPALFTQALAGLLVDWSELRHEQGFLPAQEILLTSERRGPAFTDTRLKNFFDRALLPARLCIGLLPPHEDNTRDVRMAFSAARLDMMEREVYPHLRSLIDEDLQEISEALKNSAQNGQSSPSTAEARRQAEQMLAALDDALRELLGSLSDKATSEAGSAQETVSERHRQAREAERAAEEREEAAEKSRQDTENILKSLSPFDQEYHRIAHLIEPAYNRLCELFDPQTRFSWRTGLPSGTHYNPLGMLRFEATGEGYETMHMQRDRPIEPDLFTGVLFDRSSSMSIDSRFIHARRALIFLRILYERLELPTMITWFANGVGTILTPEDSLSDSSAQVRLMRRTLSRNEGNQDGKGLKHLAQKMRAYPSGQRAIIVLTDAGVCDATGLQKMLGKLSRENTPVLHFGLGKGTADKRGFYKYSWGDLDVLDEGPNGFMATFCDVITKLATGALGKSIDDNGDVSWLNQK